MSVSFSESCFSVQSCSKTVVFQGEKLASLEVSKQARLHRRADRARRCSFFSGYSALPSGPAKIKLFGTWSVHFAAQSIYRIFGQLPFCNNSQTGKESPSPGSMIMCELGSMFTPKKMQVAQIRRNVLNTLKMALAAHGAFRAGLLAPPFTDASQVEAVLADELRTLPHGIQANGTVFALADKNMCFFHTPKPAAQKQDRPFADSGLFCQAGNFGHLPFQAPFFKLALILYGGKPRKTVPGWSKCFTAKTTANFPKKRLRPHVDCRGERDLLGGIVVSMRGGQGTTGGLALKTPHLFVG